MSDASSQGGVLGLVAGTRTRLIASFTAGLVPWLAVTIWATGYVRDASDSASADVGVITGWMLLTFVVAVLAALLAADLLFGGVWRRVNILSQRSASDGDDDVAIASAAAQPRTFQVAAMVVIAIGAMVIATHFITDDFFGWYARYGYATSTLRGDDSPRKVVILDQMTRAQDDRLVRYTDMIEAEIDKTGNAPEVVDQAILSLGEIARRMIRSVELMERGSKGGDWVRGLHTRLVTDIEPRLLAALEHKPQGTRARALIYALGAFRSVHAVPLYQQTLESPDRDRETVVAIVSAMSRYQIQTVSVRPLMGLLSGEDPELAGLAAWAIGEMYGLGTGEATELAPDPALVLLISQRLLTMPHDTQCVVLDAMLRIRAEQHAKVLFALWDATEARDRCPRKELVRRFESPSTVSKDEEMREKIVQALAGIAEGNSEVMAWLRRHSEDEVVASGLRNDMRYVLDVLAQRRTK
ncbi:MAG: hypothetical protein ACI9WU_001229 [Myxococcota bacterium]